MLSDKLKNKNNTQGITAASAVLIIAIGAIVCATAVTILLRQFEITNEAVDAANIRTRYAEMMVKVNSDTYDPVDDAYAFTVEPLEQNINRWQGRFNVPVKEDNSPFAHGTAVLYFNQADSRPHVRYEDTANAPSRYDFDSFLINNSTDFLNSEKPDGSSADASLKQGDLLVDIGKYYVVSSSRGIELSETDSADSINILLSAADMYKDELTLITGDIYSSKGLDKVTLKEGDAVYDGKAYYVYVPSFNEDGDEQSADSTASSEDDDQSKHLLKLNDK